MTSLINFWPVKRFLEYVIQRSIGKFLKNGFDLKSSDFSKKKITFKLLEINTKVIYNKIAFINLKLFTFNPFTIDSKRDCFERQSLQTDFMHH
jgi:hypothetical protein